MRTTQPSGHQKIGKQVIPLYPILFGFYPVMTLAAFNIAQIDLSQTCRAFVFSFAGTSLYPTITPVNTFRILFDSCFGQKNAFARGCKPVLAG